jgi:hypothetical protein
MYTKTTIDFNDINSAYSGYIDNLRKNEATYYEFSPYVFSREDVININELGNTSDFAVYCCNLIKNETHILNGISHLRNFTEELKRGIFNREFLQENAEELLKLLNDIINAKKVEKYKLNKLSTYDYENIDSQNELISSIIECWAFLRSGIAKYIYSGKFVAGSMNRLADIISKISVLEGLYCQNILDIAYNITKTTTK